MNKPRRLLSVVCPQGHLLAEVTATDRGALLNIRHNTLGVMPRPGEAVRVDRKAPPWSVLLSDDTVLEASCPKCGSDHQVIPFMLRSSISNGERRFVLQPWL